MKILSLFLFLTFSLFSRTSIMPLGDSITYDDAYRDHPELGGTTPRPDSERYAYRSFLWYKLHDAGFDFNFVGSRSAGSAIVPSFDPDNEGYPGETSAYITDHIYGFLQLNPADIILLHIGTNDLSSSTSEVNNILDEVDRYEDNYNHHIKVILAKIIQRQEYDSIIHSFNNNIQSLADTRKNNGDDIYLVDMENNAGLTSSDYQDRTHPNDTGYNKMATVWYNALKQVLNGSSSIPEKPTHFIATDITENSATLTWTDNADNETLIKINQGDTPIERLGSNATHYTINGLDAGETYTYSLRSCNDFGCSEIQYVTFTTEYAIPPQPTDLVTSNIESDSITLQWSDNSNNELGFKIWDVNNNTNITTVAANTTTVTISNLQANTTYTFEILAYNNEGVSEIQMITIKTKDDYAWLASIYHDILY